MLRGITKKKKIPLFKFEFVEQCSIPYLINEKKYTGTKKKKICGL